MNIMTKEKERRPGRGRLRLKAVFSVFLAALFTFLLASFSEAQSSRVKKAAVSPERSGGQVQKATAASGSEKQKAASSGSRTGQKTQPTSASVKSSQSPTAPPSIKGIPEATLQVLKENKFLEEELKLAKTPQYYFVLNLKERTLELRARGMVLKSWKASELRYTGKPVPLQVTTLTNKTALNPPARKVLNPAQQQAEEAKKAEEKARQEQQKNKESGKKEEQAQTTTAPADSFELEALEITDMPGSYELNFDDGLKIFVRSRSGFKEKFRQTRETLLWYTWYPIKHFLNRKSELRPQLILYFDNVRDAQGIYWAFIDGLKGIIWFP